MKNTILSALLFCSSICTAQSIDKNLIATAGETVTTTTAILDFSIGEPLVNKIENGTTIDQGFLAGVSEENALTTEDFSVAEEISIYPNPVSDFVTIDLGNKGDLYFLKIFSLDGKLVKQIPQLRGNSRIDLQELATGKYIVQLISEEKGKYKTFKLLKN